MPNIDPGNGDWNLWPLIGVAVVVLVAIGCFFAGAK
jgi:hypothetical protein